MQTVASGVGRRLRRELRHQAWRGAVLATRTLARLTAGQRVTPDFLIVGVQRGGTTSLYRALCQHPAFLPPWPHKGVHYFDMAYHQPLSWYLSHFPRQRHAAALAEARGHRMVTGESSPYYLWHPSAISRIADDLPEVKLLVMLRDPVERAYSAHAHESARGFESEPFARAVALEPHRLAGERERMLADPGYASHAVRHHAYLARGRYIEQLEPMTRLLGRGRIHAIDSGEFFTQPAPVFAEVCEFLGIPPPTDGIRFDRHNARPRVELPAELRSRLRAEFAPYDERLATWWGRTPSWRAGE